MVMVMVVCYGVEPAHHHVAHDEQRTLKSRIFFAHQIFPDFDLGCCPSRNEGNGTTNVPLCLLRFLLVVGGGPEHDEH